MQTAPLDIAATAARLVVEEGLEYGPAKRRAAKLLGAASKGNSRGALPSNDLVEAEVRDYLQLFCADSQPGELQALRDLAAQWMRRLPSFRPHLGGAVWRGTATRRNDVFIQLFCDDPKSAEIALIDQRIAYTAQTVAGFTGDAVDALSIHSFCKVLQEDIGVHLMVYDHDDLRGALKPDGTGRTLRGDLAALERLMASEVMA